MTYDISFDGDSTEIDGITYTFKVEPDYFMSLLDEQGEGVWCGRIEWNDNDTYSSLPIKPSHFVNGRTVRLDTDRNSTLWWEVPSDVPMNERSGLERTIRDCLHYGYSVFVVESSDGFTACVGGVEPNAEVQDFVGELIGEIESDRELADRAAFGKVLASVGLAGFEV